MAAKDQKKSKIAELMGHAALEKKGLMPVIIDLNGLSSVADYFVIVSGKTDVHVRTICLEMERTCKEEGIPIYHREGMDSCTWVLLDLGDVLVHIFRQTEREYYKLEDLWKSGAIVPLPKL